MCYDVIVSIFSSATITTTPPNATLVALSDSSVSHDTWNMYNYTYTASGNTTVQLNFTTQINKHCDWLIDDVSVQNSIGLEILTNGNFESSPASIGWNPSPPSAGACTVRWNSSIPCRSGSCYVHDCHSATGSPTSLALLTQNINVLDGQFYKISFWSRLEVHSGGASALLFLRIF